MCIIILAKLDWYHQSHTVNLLYNTLLLGHSTANIIKYKKVNICMILDYLVISLYVIFSSILFGINAFDSFIVDICLDMNCNLYIVDICIASYSFVIFLL